MYLSELRIQNLRSLGDVVLTPTSGWNAFVGPNGAGKTSVLEAVFLLSHGRSFRRGARESLSSIGSTGFSVFGSVSCGNGRERRLGLSRAGGKLESRVDGEATGLSGLVEACAVVCFEPGSHELINGAAEERRRYLDWGVFHVEHAFLEHWRRYQRALRQRNSALRNGADVASLEPWEIEMAESGHALTQMRKTYFEHLRPVLDAVLGEFLTELGAPAMAFDQGWKEGSELLETWAESRQRDRERGHTGRGPHRADWSIGFEAAPRKEHLSRGQEKLCALALVLAQARLHAELSGEWPMVCLDDLGSELDLNHQARVIELIHASGAQVLVTGTDLPAGVRDLPGGCRVFHVEQGRVVGEPSSD
ncbi:DNA replication/repair protein RecF [Dokdonella sp.]|uniref:DNA replication/repair protein RecF n=1 Tax=Dokdonella sp. TaxID=2291710 RepID=UPI0035276A56